jgi:diacylglycerol kinase (ATP)
MKYFLIINPRSKSGRSRRFFGPLLEEFNRRGMDFDHVFVSSYEHIRMVSEQANRQGYDVVVAVGGDGTINATINGFYDAAGSRISKSRFGVIYTGTSPDFCRSYGIPVDPVAATAILFDGGVRSIRLGRLVFSPDQDTGKSVSRLFACCANIGLGAGIARQSNRTRKYTGDFLGTLMALISQVAFHGPQPVGAVIDGEPKEWKKMLNLSAGRTRFIASGIRVPEGLADDDDRFYLLLAAGIGLSSIPRMLYHAYTGKPDPAGVLRFSYFREAALFAPGREVGVECDGDPVGFLPCSISLAADPLDLIVAKIHP